MTSVSFPQYAARVEQIGETPNVTVVVRCAICGVEVLRRSWVGFEKQSPDDEIELSVDASGQTRITGASTEALRVMAEQRLADSKADRETYWTHLTTQHPERFR